MKKGSLLCLAVVCLGGAALKAQPAEVTLVAPADDSKAAPVTPVFTWNTANGADSYEIEIARKKNMKPTTIDVDGLVDNSFTPDAELAEDRTYYWRVRAVDDENGAGDWSQRWSFQTGQLPDKATLVAPDNQEEDVALKPELVWKEADGAASYEVEISSVSDFSTIAYQRDGIEGTSVMLPIDLEADTRYYWRVRASNPIGDGPYTDTRWFVTVQSSPAQVSLLLPPDGATGIDTRPTFSWEAITGADTYTLEVALSSDFASLVFQSSGVTTTSITPSSALANGTVLYWRVYAMNGAGAGPTSVVRDFVTETGGPTQVVLVSPPDNSEDVASAPILVWEPVQGAANYRLQVSGRSDFSGDMLHDTVVGGTQFQIGPLGFDAEYFWRVRASNAGSENWSVSARFRTSTGAPAQVTLASPLDGALEQPLQPVLAWNASSLAETYNLQIGLDAEFTVILVEATGLTLTNYTTERLAAITDYFWRVQAVNAVGIGPWSSGRKFTTRLVLAPAAPVLIYPPDGADGVALGPVFSWNAIGGATSYKLELSTSPLDESDNFISVVVAVVVTQPFFQSPTLSPSSDHYWRVEARNEGGSAWSPVWSFSTGTITATEPEEIPADFTLEQNYPNPFNPSTRIQYALPEQAPVLLTVTDVSGRRVATLVSKVQHAGVHQVVWDGHTEDGTAAASGVYLYRIETPGFTKARRLVLAK